MIAERLSDIFVDLKKNPTIFRSVQAPRSKRLKLNTVS